MKKTIIVMPVANEEDTMEKILDEILALPYDNLYIYPVIDSYSKDRTEEIIRRKAACNDRVKCIFYRESRGVISCYLEGFRRALKDGAEQILEMDGGGSHLPKEIPQFLKQLEEGYDFVQGSRFVEGGRAVNTPFIRNISVRLIHAPIISKTAGQHFTDTTNAFRAYSARYLKDPRVAPLRDIFMGYELLAYLSVRATQLGYQACEIPVTRAYPKKGKTPTKINFWKGNSALMKILLKNRFGAYNP